MNEIELCEVIILKLKSLPEPSRNELQRMYGKTWNLVAAYHEGLARPTQEAISRLDALRSAIEHELLLLKRKERRVLTLAKEQEGDFYYAIYDYDNLEALIARVRSLEDAKGLVSSTNILEETIETFPGLRGEGVVNGARLADFLKERIRGRCL